jgi:uncharacterized protein YjiS (DUF1127 family)
MTISDLVSPATYVRPFALGRAVMEIRLIIAARAKRLTAALDLLNNWLDRACQRRMLAGLDSRALADMGFTRADAWTESSKPFWRR